MAQASAAARIARIELVDLADVHGSTYTFEGSIAFKLGRTETSARLFAEFVPGEGVVRFQVFGQNAGQELSDGPLFEYLRSLVDAAHMAGVAKNHAEMSAEQWWTHERPRFSVNVPRGSIRRYVSGRYAPTPRSSFPLHPLPAPAQDTAVI